MRFVSIKAVQEGMVLGKTLRAKNGEVLLKAGTALSAPYIRAIKDLYYAGLYITDELSQDIEIYDIISDDLRQSSTGAVKRLFSRTGAKDAAGARRELVAMSNSLNQIVDDIFSNSSVMVNIVDLKVMDTYLFQHSVNVAVLSVVIGTKLGFLRNELINLGMAAILHDIGNSFVDARILNKPGRLTADEMEHVRTHTKHGFDYIKAHYDLPAQVYVSVLQHHEHFDGTGYPFGKKGDNIPLNARIIAVADVFDAMTSKRPYHDAILPSEAFEYILGNAGQHFDGRVVDAFVRKVAPYPLGLTVETSNGIQGIVSGNYEDCLTRPVVKVLPSMLAKTGGRPHLDLKNDPSLMSVTITKVI